MKLTEEMKEKIDNYFETITMDQFIEETKELEDITTESRHKCNKEIITIISDFLEKHPEMRFMQALYALSLIDNSGEDWFYEESSETLKILKR